MYGKDDPWVNTFWGLQVKQQLPEAPYYQISPAGHCPHDEVPEVFHLSFMPYICRNESLIQPTGCELLTPWMDQEHRIRGQIQLTTP